MSTTNEDLRVGLADLRTEFADRDRAVGERLAQIAAERAEHDRIATEKQAERDRVFAQTVANLQTRIAEVDKSLTRLILYASFGIVGTLGVFIAVFGVFVELRANPLPAAYYAPPPAVYYAPPVASVQPAPG